MPAGFLTTAIDLIRPPQAGQARASTPNVRPESSAHLRYPLRGAFAPAVSGPGSSASGAGTIRDRHPLAAPSTPA